MSWDGRKRQWTGGRQDEAGAAQFPAPWILAPSYGRGNFLGHQARLARHGHDRIRPGVVRRRDLERHPVRTDVRRRTRTGENGAWGRDGADDGWTGRDGPSRTERRHGRVRGVLGSEGGGLGARQRRAPFSEGSATFRHSHHGRRPSAKLIIPSSQESAERRAAVPFYPTERESPEYSCVTPRSRTSSLAASSLCFIVYRPAF